LGDGARVVLTMSGRGDKDVDEVVEVAGWDVGVARAFRSEASAGAGAAATTDRAPDLDAEASDR
ncbi:MAG: hypothetical protein ACLFS9_01040, partial [Nitriliruptoraceae bacterium]